MSDPKPRTLEQRWDDEPAPGMGPDGELCVVEEDDDEDGDDTPEDPDPTRGDFE